jgi:hypothetical protein
MIRDYLSTGSFADRCAGKDCTCGASAMAKSFPTLKRIVTMCVLVTDPLPFSLKIMPS